MGDRDDWLVAAAERGDVAKVGRLLGNGVPKTRAGVLHLALMWAASNGHADCVALLLPFSDARARDIRGRTALMHAAAHAFAGCVELLLPVSDANAVDSTGLTAAAHAKAWGDDVLSSRIAGYARSQEELAVLDGSVQNGAAKPESARRRI